MSLIKKVFGDLSLTWPKIIIWAVAAGVYTGLMAMLPAAANTSFENISIYFEAWILFGIIIIMNSASPVESALKCFVFFLVSQPLAYLVQVPFSRMGWGIFTYYKPWFIWTLFTLVMGSVGWFMKKQKVWGVLILAPMLLILAYLGSGFLANAIYWFPHNLLSYIFCVVTMLIYPIAIFTEKKPRRIALVLAGILAAAATVMAVARPTEYATTPIVSNGSSRIVFDDTYTAALSDQKMGDVQIVYEPGIDDYSVRATFRHAGRTQLVLTSPEGEQTIFNLTVRYHDYDIELEKRGSEQPDPPLDYSDTSNWAYYAVGEGKDADLFLICPTVDMNDEYNMSLDDEETKASFAGALNMERGLYEDVSRMYAPYYRQAAMKVYSLPEDEREQYLAAAYSDISDAFSWYLANENNGRPIILAGFSQGADMCYRLLMDHFRDEYLCGQLVAVYAIGWPCTAEMADNYPQIIPASGEYDTGVVVSFDCEAPDVTETFINPAGQKAYAINPLNWKTDTTPADKAANIGACFTDYSGGILKEEEQLCGGYLDGTRGVLKVTDVEPADYPALIPGLPEGSYHIYDYQFFFRNLQKNVVDRVDKYIEQLEDEAA